MSFSDPKGDDVGPGTYTYPTKADYKKGSFDLTDVEIKDRQEFAFEAAVRMRDRFMSQEVWERMGVPVKEIGPMVLADPTRILFQSMLFSKIVPNCKKLGLLDRNDQWLRRRFEEMNVIQFEDWADTGEEYTAFALEEPVA